MSWLIQSPAACFHTREMDLHPRQVESEAEITASNNNSLPRSVCQEQLAERTRGVTYHQRRERLKLWKQRAAACLPQINSRMRPRAKLPLEALPGGGGGPHQLTERSGITCRLFQVTTTQQTAAAGFFQVPNPPWQKPEGSLVLRYVLFTSAPVSLNWLSCSSQVKRRIFKHERVVRSCVVGDVKSAHKSSYFIFHPASLESYSAKWWAPLHINSAAFDPHGSFAWEKKKKIRTPEANFLTKIVSEFDLVTALWFSLREGPPAS